MPQAPTANLALIRPTELGDSGVWASLLDAMFAVIDVHDHTPGKGVLIPMASGVSIAADVPWSSGGAFYAITNLKAIDFQPQPISAMSTFAGALFVNSANNELSYRTTGGAIVQFTNGGTFNFAAIGAIGGDYTSIGALVQYVDASDLYQFLQQVGGGVRQYARLDCGGVDFFEYKAQPAVGVPSNRIRLASPAALAAAYDLTLPGALPAAPQLVAVDAAGVLSFAATGGIGAVTLAANQSVTVSGTGLFKHGTLTLTIPLRAPLSGSSPTAVSLQAGVSDPGCFPFSLPVGARILRTRAVITDTNSPTTLKVGLMTVDATSSTASNFGGASAGTGAQQTIASAAMTVTVLSGAAYYVEVTIVAGAGVCSIKSCEVDFDQP